MRLRQFQKDFHLLIKLFQNVNIPQIYVVKEITGL